MRYQHDPVSGALTIVMFAHEDPETLQEAEARYERHRLEEERLQREGPRRSWRSIVKEALRDYEMTHDDLARESGIGRSTIQNWFSGRAKPSPANIAKLCLVLNLNQGDLMERVGYVNEEAA